ncbi:hypothetical protein SRHO_G00107940 [Serrasalmus rhombeus]
MAAAQAADYTAVVFSLTSRPQSDGWRQQTAGRPLLNFSSAAATLHAAPSLLDVSCVDMLEQAARQPWGYTPMEHTLERAHSEASLTDATVVR